MNSEYNDHTALQASLRKIQIELLRAGTLSTALDLEGLTQDLEGMGILAANMRRESIEAQGGSKSAVLRLRKFGELQQRYIRS